MRAAYIEQLGSPETMRYGELPALRPGPSDVVVDTVASSVNHVDTYVRSGAWTTQIDFPFIIGRDLIGTVAAAGPAAMGFRPGEWVWCNSMRYEGRQGAATEQAVVPAARLYHLPEGTDPLSAVALAHPAATAYLALVVHGRLRVGETVAVLGAAGNVGSALVVLAARAGANVIAVASAEDVPYCHELGATDVLDYREPDLAARIRRVAPEGVDLYLDTSGKNDLESAVDLLANRGRMVLLAGLQARPVLPVGSLYALDRSIHGYAISRANTAELAEAASATNRLLAHGLLQPRRIEVLPLSHAATAHRRLEDGAVRGRIVLRHDGVQDS